MPPESPHTSPGVQRSETAATLPVPLLTGQAGLTLRVQLDMVGEGLFGDYS